MKTSSFSEFVEVRSVQNEYELNQAIQLVSKNLVEDECLTQSLKLNFDDVYNGFLMPCFPSFKNILELQIVSIFNGKIVGAMLSKDMFDSFHPEPTEKNEAYDEILEQQKQKLFSEKILQPFEGNYLHIFFVVTDSNYRAQGLAQRMIEIAIQKAPLRGFKEAFIECTSPASTHIAKKLGFQEKGKQIYKNFKSKDGQNPYACNEELYGSDADTFLMLQLQENKEKIEVSTEQKFSN